MISQQSYTGQFALQLTLLLVALSTLITSTENLYFYKIYVGEGWLSWQRLRPCRPIYTKYPAIGRLSDFLFTYPAVLLLIGIRIVFSIATLAASLKGPVPAGYVIGLSAISLLLYLRNQFSNNGSDQLSNVILVSAAVSYLDSYDNLVLPLSLFFIACQSTLSYLTSGWLKLLTREWRKGNCLIDIFHTATFGHPWITGFLGERQRLYSLISMAVIFLEISLGCCFVLPPAVCLVLLACGALLHSSIAFTMGLNNFLWTFPATYPCVYFISIKIHHLFTA